MKIKFKISNCPNDKWIMFTFSDSHINLEYSGIYERHSMDNEDYFLQFCLYKKKTVNVIRAVSRMLHIYRNIK